MCVVRLCKICQRGLLALGGPPQFEKCSKLTGTIIRVVGRSRGVNVVVAQKIIRPVSAWHARNFTMNLVLRLRAKATLMSSVVRKPTCAPHHPPNGPKLGSWV